jgi:hypothetical protein
MATRRPATARRTLAAAVMICLVFGPGFIAPVQAQSAAEETGHGSIRGTLFQSDEKTPLAGAKVIAINVRTGRQFTSEPTTEGGSYAVTDMTGGTYDVVVEVGGNLFVVDNIVDLSPGEGVSRSFAVQPQRPANRKIAKMPMPQGSATPIGESAATPHFWTSTSGKVLIGVLAAGAAVALYNGLKNDDQASPSSP